MKNPLSPNTSHQTRIYGAAMLASLIGLADSMYLAVQHLAGRSVRCTVTTGCSAVLGSHYATFAGVPTAAFGAMAYFVAFSFATCAAFGYERARSGLALIVVPMLITTVWLLYLQAFVLHAFCDYCLLSAAMTLMLTALVAADRFAAPGGVA
jgi:uncharacterized membrane protein